MMRLLGDLIRWQTMSGVTFSVGRYELTPVSKALVVRLPYLGLVWNRPVAIWVDGEGQRERVPIPDVTGIALLTMVGLSLALMVYGFVLASRERSRQNG